MIVLIDWFTNDKEILGVQMYCKIFPERARQMQCSMDSDNRTHLDHRAK